MLRGRGGFSGTAELGGPRRALRGRGNSAGPGVGERRVPWRPFLRAPAKGERGARRRERAASAGRSRPVPAATPRLLPGVPGCAASLSPPGRLHVPGAGGSWRSPLLSAVAARPLPVTGSVCTESRVRAAARLRGGGFPSPSWGVQGARMHLQEHGAHLIAGSCGWRASQHAPAPPPDLFRP